MVLNYIWITLFIIAFVVCAISSIFYGDVSVWTNVMQASFDSAGLAFEISIGLTGILALWMGLMKIGEEGGVIGFLAEWCHRCLLDFFPVSLRGIRQWAPFL